MDVLMTPVADDQGLAAARGHALDPEGSLFASRPVQIGETVDVVDLERPFVDFRRRLQQLPE